MFDSRPHWKALQRKTGGMQAGVTLGLADCLGVVYWLRQEGACPEGAISRCWVGLGNALPVLLRFRALQGQAFDCRRKALGDKAEAEAGLGPRLHKHATALGAFECQVPGVDGHAAVVCYNEVSTLILLVLASMGVMLLYRR